MTEPFDAFLLLKIADSPVLPQFLHDCVDDLVGNKHADFDNYNSDIEWTSDDFNKAKKSIQNFYRQNINEHQLPDLTTDLSGNIKEELNNCFLVRRDDIYEALIREKFIENGHNLVESFDWKLKWVLGSSKLATIQKALLQMDLICLKQSIDEGGESSGRNLINFELDQSTLTEFIEQLERVNCELNSTSNTTD